MKQSSMTARVSAFARAYHANEKGEKVFCDLLAKRMLSEEEYEAVANSMIQGAAYFGFGGEGDEALKRIVSRQLAPTPLGRAVWAEDALNRAVRTGSRQYLIFGAGYDTFAYRQPDWARGLEIFLIDREETLEDHKRRVLRAGLEVLDNVHYVEADLSLKGWEEALEGEEGFSRTQKSFVSLLGLVYYLKVNAFEALLSALGGLLGGGSSLAFDYPSLATAEPCAQRENRLAAAAGEEMKAAYSYGEMERILEEAGFLIYEHLDAYALTERFFVAHNNAHPENGMRMPEHVRCCLAVKRDY